MFRDGQPFWLVGQGLLEDGKANIPLIYTRGTGFGANFNTADVEVIPWGSVRLELEDNNHLKLSWTTGVHGFRDGQMDMVRLSTIKPTSAESRVLNSCHSGSWFNPDESGHGLMVEVIEQDGQPSMTLAWYHYYSGEQFWLVAKGPVVGRKVQLTAFSNSGGMFPPDFISSDVQTTQWGSIEFELLDDYKAKITWNSLNPDFPPGSLNLVKLSQLDRYRCN